ncbi:YggS family pyridoxal phosphate-dependent enzyme [Glaciecola sp. XM2]|jgi:pyridoxal phosphate enzyme (YggS family)|uniref:YggS family pyridoxal phosphate-dependent enzyme n=1 Tax=Glaciecola sp. XM2 TaxID=1914931 RepID=UPI001BDE5E12|nr:YggS family pyridoxal phosphate-dependent enzyme [Glaciecola sp. XM2]MBT1450443.1 YggS family pyridoxal phosphate-dependent enzyme [Glaciecola sp. XM2]
MTASTSPIADNLHQVRVLIDAAATACSRNPKDIHLLAVSKTKPVSDILLAYENGHRDFGENYVQEGVEKIQQLKQYSDILWHFIGPLQSNKSKFVAEYFDWMHSVDRFKIAKRLNDQRSVYQKPLNICIQVNIDDELSKSGVAPSEVLPLLKEVSSLDRIKCRGLMTIPEASNDIDHQRQSFAQMQALFNQCKAIYPEFDTLSMGMSNDLALAIEHGSTMVRVGTGIFGARDK